MATRALAELGIEFVIAVLVGAAIWAGWLGWDNEYYYDSAVGAYQGPYRPAQVVGCALTVGLLIGVLVQWWNPWVVPAGVTVGFWTSWTVQAGSHDESGLFLVGSILLLVGLLPGTALASGIGLTVRRARERRSGQAEAGSRRT